MTPREANEQLGLDLLEGLLSKVGWQEALARACAEILEGDWAPTVSGGSDASLWPSQEQGIAQSLWVLENVGSVLVADATGSGKTRTGAHLISALQDRNSRTSTRRDRQPILICPPTLEQPWKDELSAAGESVTVFSHGILGRDDGTRQAELRSTRGSRHRGRAGDALVVWEHAPGEDRSAWVGA